MMSPAITTQLQTAARLLAMLCLAGAMPNALAQAEISYTLSFPAGVPRNEVIAPGATGAFAFTVTSTSAAAGNAAVTGAFQSRSAAINEYAFVSDDARCTAPIVATPAVIERIIFVAGPLNPNESLTCAYRITRAQNSRDDLGFVACGPRNGTVYCQNAFRRGSLPDLSLSLERVFPDPSGNPAPLFRLSLHNHSQFDVERRLVTTECREFQGGVFDPVNYTLQGTFPGGCISDPYDGCVNFGGQNFQSLSFRFGSVPAGGSTSCLIRVVHQPGASAISNTDLFMLDGGPYDSYDLVSLSNGGLAFDPDLANDVAVLAGGDNANPIPISATAILALALALGVAGLIVLRRQSAH